MFQVTFPLRPCRIILKKQNKKYCLWWLTDTKWAFTLFNSSSSFFQCDNDGEIEYEFPCFNQVETLDGLWEKVDPRYTDGVYGGVRLQSPAPTQYILPPIYIRLQVCQTFFFMCTQFMSYICKLGWWRIRGR